MATTGLPPPPINDAPGSFTWLEWYRQLRNYISTSGSVPWYIINFADSNLSDIQNRDHNVLTNIQGGTAGERYHLTAAQWATLGSGDHNDLANIQGGSSTERYHLTEIQSEKITTVPTQNLVGRYSAGTGEAQFIKLGTNLSISGDTLNATGGGSAIPVSDEGTQLTAGVTSFNFTGAGVTASAVGNAVTVNVPATSDSTKLSLTGGTMTGTIGWNQNGGTGSISIQPDPGSPGGTAMDIVSPDGMTIRAPYLVLDSDAPVLTMPGPVVNAPIIVAGIDALGGALLGYGTPTTAGYVVSDTHDANVVIKTAGSVPPTAWVPLGLSVTLAQDAPAGYASIQFSANFSNPTTRTGTVEFGLNVNGTDLSRDIVQQIPANFNSTIAISIPLINAYSAGDVITLIARITVNNNNAFSFTMLASPTDLAEFRFSVVGTSGLPEAPTDGKLYGRQSGAWEEVTATSTVFIPYETLTATDVQAAIQQLKEELDTLKSQLYAYG